jgi:hypothetical protein
MASNQEHGVTEERAGELIRAAIPSNAPEPAQD